MNYFSLVVALGLFLASIALLLFALRGLRNAGWVLMRRTRPIRELAVEPVEVEGRLSADSPLRLDASRKPLIAARYRVERYFSARKSSGWVEQGTVTRAISAELRDATGSCRIELDHASLDIVGPTRRWLGTWSELLAQDSELASTLSSMAPGFEGTRLRITRTMIEHGARVLVLGDAKKNPAPPQDDQPANETEDSATYRQAPPKKPGAERFSIEAGKGGTLIVSSAGHTVTLFALAWRPTLAVVSSIVLALLASIVMVQDVWFALLLPR